MVTSCLIKDPNEELGVESSVWSWLTCGPESTASHPHAHVAGGLLLMGQAAGEGESFHTKGLCFGPLRGFIGSRHEGFLEAIQGRRSSLDSEDISLPFTCSPGLLPDGLWQPSPAAAADVLRRQIPLSRGEGP